MNDTNASFSGTMSARQPTHEEISHHAQELWEKYGRPSGRDEAIWLEAERDLQREGVRPEPAATSRPTEAPPAPSAPGATVPPGEPAPTAAAATRAPQRSSRASATPRMPAAGRSPRSTAR